MADSSSSSSSEEAENAGPCACVAMDCDAKPKPKISQVISAGPMASPHFTHRTSHSSTGHTIEATGIYYYTGGVTTESVHWCSSSWGRRRRTAGRRAVLRNVGCRARPGQILAVAGPSGAGKSTLLGLLAGRLRPGAGALAVDGRAATTAQLRHISALVAQEEALFPLLTVEETLTFSARLRLRGLPRAEMAARVAALLDELGLRHVAGRRVGSGISGGERRRVAIGMDVVHEPRVLLLDEPTSGLDSAAAVGVASMLKRMASAPHGRTLVVSIHQPGCRLLHMFDSLLLLRGGCVVHHGSLDLLSARLAAAGRVPPKHLNVLEFAMENLDSLSSSSSHPHVKDKDPPTTFGHLLNVPVLDEETAMVDNTAEAKRMTTTYANGPWRETLILTERAWKNTVRSKRLFLGRTLQALLVGLLLGTLFLRIGTRAGDAALQDRAGFFAFTLTFLLSSTTEGLPMYLAERRILRRETAQGAYRVASHVAAGAVAAVPVLALAVLAFALPAYWLVGLAPAPAAFAVFVGVAWLAMAAASSLVACLAALAPDFIMGNSLISGVMGAFFLFSGYFIAKEDIPAYWLFAHYLSLFKYPFEAFVVNEFVRLPTPQQRCRQRDEDPLLGSCPLDAQAFLRSRGLHRHDVWRNALVLAMFGVAYRVLCFVVLYCKCSSPSPSSSLPRRRRRRFGLLRR